MNTFMKISIAQDIQEAMDHLRQMQSCVQDGDIQGAEHFMDKVREAFEQAQEGLFEAGFKAQRV
jgi:hypothetical protein